MILPALTTREGEKVLREQRTEQTELVTEATWTITHGRTQVNDSWMTDASRKTNLSSIKACEIQCDLEMTLWIKHRQRFEANCLSTAWNPRTSDSCYGSQRSAPTLWHMASPPSPWPLFIMHTCLFFHMCFVGMHVSNLLFFETLWAFQLFGFHFGLSLVAAEKHVWF